MAFKKGKSGNPKGRPPVLLPEVQSLIDKDRNAVRVAILQLLNLSEDEFEEKARKRLPMIERVICQCIEKIAVNGDTGQLRMLLEIPLGKLPADPKEFEVSPEEKELVLEFRKRINEQRAIEEKPD